MDNIERILSEGKNELDNLKLPEDIESRLRDALSNVPNKKKRVGFKGKVAVLIIVTFLIGYHVDTLAYYAKRLIGYDNVMNGTLQELNELGKRQVIDESYTFKNGVKITLDGIMLDDNNLIAFYTIYDPSGNVQEAYSDLSIHQIEGVFGKTYNYSGHGEASEDGKEMKWVITCDKPRFYERKMKLKMSSYKMREMGEVKFTLDRNQAMGHSLKIPINKEIEIDGRKIKIESLVASPTSTVIKGRIQSIIEIGVDEIKGERFMPGSIELGLIADGKEVQIQGSGISTDMKGSQFDISYDVLPGETSNIEIVLKFFGGNHDVNELIELKKGRINKDIKVLEQDMRINEIYELEGNTYINITTDESLALSKVLLNIDGEKIEAGKTIPGDYEKIVEGENVKINYTRTIEFNGIGEGLELDIQRITYNKSYDKVVYKYSIK